MQATIRILTSHCAHYYYRDIGSMIDTFNTERVIMYLFIAQMHMFHIYTAQRFRILTKFTCTSPVL